MQLLNYIFKKYRFFIFFILLESVAAFLIIQNYNFHREKFVSSANFITGGFYEKVTNLKDYFSLKQENEALANENKMLREKIEYYRNAIDTNFVTSNNFPQFQYKTARVIKNSYSDSHNFLTINSGLNDSVNTEMAVVSSLGIIGITEKVSSRYARVQSILNLNTKINAKLKNSNHFGTLTWNGENYDKVQLLDVPRQAVVNIGDTIITGGMSTVFPEGILIGKVTSVNQKTTTSSVLEIELFNDMSNLNHVYVISNKHKKEIEKLEENE